MTCRDFAECLPRIYPTTAGADSDSGYAPHTPTKDMKRQTGLSAKVVDDIQLKGDLVGLSSLCIVVG